MTITEPDQLPPLVAESDSTQTQARPSADILAGNQVVEAIGNSAGIAPTVTPPGEAALASDGATASQWLDNKKIVGLWSHDADRNAFAAVSGLGWRKIERTTPSGFANLAMLTSVAHDTNARCRIQLTDDVITSIYVF